MKIDPQYKTFWRRLAAAFLDGAALAPVALLDRALWNDAASAAVLLPWAFLYQGVGLAYYVGFLYRYGQTPGKMAAGVVVRSHREGRLSFVQAVLRNVVLILFAPVELFIIARNVTAGHLENRGLGDEDQMFAMGLVLLVWVGLEMITMLFSAKRRALHDFIAGTVVVRQPVSERVGAHVQIRVVLVLLLLSSFVLRIVWTDPNLTAR